MVFKGGIYPGVTKELGVLDGEAGKETAVLSGERIKAACV
jgi:hypothetical protein